MKNVERQMLILSTVVDEYIRTGEPVGSNAVLARLNMGVSSATVRNDMASLERQGLLEQPHTSAGRVPTCDGYRYYINNLMSPKPLSTKEKKLIDSLLCKGDLSADAVVDTAINVLSEVTNMAVVAKRSRPKFSVITRVEVIPAGRRMYALLMITSTGSVKNKVCRMEFDLTYEQLDYFSKFVQQNIAGISIENLTEDYLDNLAVALGSYMVSLSPLLNALYQLGEEVSKNDVDFVGEENLYHSDSFSSDEIVKLLEHKQELLDVVSDAFDGVSIMFGKEEGTFAVTNSSMILSTFGVGDETLGKLGVIGPMRVDYSKIIPHIEYIANTVTRLLTAAIEDEDENTNRKED